MRDEELIDEREQDGFKIRLYACPEDCSPVGMFDSGDAALDQEVIDKIEDGTYTWFVAKVTASKNGIELGTDYLGGCCYKSTEEFVKQDDYYSDMRKTAITEAKKAIKGLTK